MNVKEQLKNDILVGMRMYLDATVMAILETVIVQAMQNIEMIQMDMLPATVDNTNSYILELFMVRKAPKLSEKTVEAYLRTVKEFITFTNKPLNKISECDVEMYLYEKKRMNNNNTSLNNNRRNLSAFFTWMRKVKLITDNPCDGVEPFEIIEKPIDHMDVLELQQVTTGCRHKRDRAILEFMRCTAMRRGEVPLVNINDVDFSTGSITIYGHKTGRYRTVFLDKIAIYYIREYLKDRGVSENSHEPLFTHICGDMTVGLSRDGLYSTIKAIAGRSGVERRIYPHLYRKTVATQIVRRGGSDEVAGEYLGHAPKNVTGRHYTYKGTDHVKQIFRNYVEAV